MEDSHSLQIPLSAPLPKPTIDYRKVSKALQLITDRAKPFLVPVLCQLWDHVDKTTMSRINEALQVETEEEALTKVKGALDLAVFPIPPHVEKLLLAAVVFHFQS